MRSLDEPEKIFEFIITLMAWCFAELKHEKCSNHINSTNLFINLEQFHTNVHREHTERPKLQNQCFHTTVRVKASNFHTTTLEQYKKSTTICMRKKLSPY